jgi:hypothetical protein
MTDGRVFHVCLPVSPIIRLCLQCSFFVLLNFRASFNVRILLSQKGAALCQTITAVSVWPQPWVVFVWLQCPGLFFLSLQFLVFFLGFFHSHCILFSWLYLITFSCFLRILLPTLSAYLFYFICIHFVSVSLYSYFIISLSNIASFFPFDVLVNQL